MKTITIFLLIIICPPFLRRVVNAWNMYPFGFFACHLPISLKKKWTVIFAIVAYFSLHDYLFFLRAVLGCDKTIFFAPLNDICKKISFQRSWRWVWWISIACKILMNWANGNQSRIYLFHAKWTVSIACTKRQIQNTYSTCFEWRKVKWNQFLETFRQTSLKWMICFSFFLLHLLKCQSQPPHQLRLYTWIALSSGFKITQIKSNKQHNDKNRVDSWSLSDQAI